MREKFLHWLSRRVTACGYRVVVRGREHLPSPHQAALVVSNHVSFIDWLILLSVMPRYLHFIIYRGFYDHWAYHHFLKFSRVIPINDIHEGRKKLLLSIRHIVQHLQHQEWLFLFPEGEITSDGEMQPFKRGLEWIAQRSQCPVVPIKIEGLWGSMFSRYPHGRAFSVWNGFRRRKIYLTIGKPFTDGVSGVEVAQKIAAMKHSQLEEN